MLSFSYQEKYGLCSFSPNMTTNECNNIFFVVKLENYCPLLLTIHCSGVVDKPGIAGSIPSFSSLSDETINCGPISI